MNVEQSVERELAEKTEVLGENLTQRHFVLHKSRMARPWPPRWEASDEPPELWRGILVGNITTTKLIIKEEIC
jgi:hypothetical protein